jgi:restriction endonuclease S subunit
MRKLFALSILICLTGSLYAQDLNARVQVLSPKIQTTNKRIFQVLETAMKDFLNGRKWSADEIAPAEKIDCNFVLNITSWDGNSTFSGELQVQSSRPVFNSSYTSTLFSVNDKDIDFTYTEGQTIDFNAQNFQSNLSSIMAYYAYIILGFDYDSFSRYGGTPYFANAQTVVINAQSSAYSGWKAFDSNNFNRYWLSENLINKTYIPLRSFYYDYHRKGLDLMVDNAEMARRNIDAVLPALTQLDRQRLGATLPTLFFTAKSDELVGVFTGALPTEKLAAYNLLMKADPANGPKYQILQKN